MSRFGRDVVDQNLLIRLFDANVTALVVLPPNECLSEPSRQYPPQTLLARGGYLNLFWFGWSASAPEGPH